MVLYFLIMLFSSFLLSASEEIKEEKVSKTVIAPEGTTIEGDYFAMGKIIEISSDVQGDLYVCGGQIVIDGKIEGDILAIGGSIIVLGEVAGNIRLLGGQVTFGGKVAKNGTIIAGSAQLLPQSYISGNLVGVLGNGDVAADIGEDFTAIASNLRISSTIQGNLDAYVGQMRLNAKAKVDGNVDYTSTHDALIDPKTVIRGKLTQHTSVDHNFLGSYWIHGLLLGSKLMSVVMNFFYSLAVGLVILKLFPNMVHSAVEALEKYPLKSVANGILLLIFLPLAFLVLLVTVLGAPFALTLLAFNIITFYTAKIIFILWGSKRLFKQMKYKLTPTHLLMLGLVIYFGLVAIPFVGSVVSFGALLLGLGSSVISFREGTH